jgi:hypothetical protein
MKPFKIFRYRIIKFIAWATCCSELLDQEQYDRVVPTYTESAGYVVFADLDLVSNYYRELKEDKKSLSLNNVVDFENSRFRKYHFNWEELTGKITGNISGDPITVTLDESSRGGMRKIDWGAWKRELEKEKPLDKIIYDDPRTLFAAGYIKLLQYIRTKPFPYEH